MSDTKGAGTAARWRARGRGGLRRLREAWRDRRRRRVLLGLALVAGLGLGSGGLAAAWTRACAGTCPTADQVDDYAPRQASLVLDARGGVLGSFYRERRTLVALDSLPRHVSMAFVAIEDQRFFRHEGVDPQRVLGAIRDNIVEGFGASGGSTITMQLARNLFPQQLPAGEKSLRRKIAEVKLALEIERRHPKGRILEMYLNTIYLGAGAYGIEAASRTYFNKPARQLTYLEAATLAALPKAPSYYNPRRNPEAAEARRNLVLEAMAQQGYVTAEQAAAGKAEPLVLPPPTGASSAPYFVEQVRLRMEEMFGELAYTGGLRIETAIDPALQRTAEEALEAQLRRVEAGEFGRYRHTTYERFVAGLEEGEAVTHTPYLQGLVVVLDPASGRVKAMVGGRDWKHSQFNRATQARRQPGSAFKPFVFAAALEKGRSPLSGVSDAPFSLAMSDGSVWSPKNYDGTSAGYTNLRSALRNSRNLATIHLGREVGMDAVRSVARRAGLESDIPGYPSVYIGSAAVRPADLIAAYAAFGNGGNRVEPQYVTRVLDHQGRVLWQAPRYPRSALDPAVSWILTDMMREVVDRGTGYAVRDPGAGGLPYEVPAAGKTGTTNDATDIWFVGYTPDLLAGVWIGMDVPRPILPRATGGGIAAPVWARIMREAYADRPAPEPWPRPAGVVTRGIRDGRAITDDCPWGPEYTDYFAARFAPEPSCDVRMPSDEMLVDPTPWLPGRPVFPGQPRVPVATDYVGPPPPSAPPAPERRP